MADTDADISAAPESPLRHQMEHSARSELPSPPSRVIHWPPLRVLWGSRRAVINNQIRGAARNGDGAAGREASLRLRDEVPTSGAAVRGALSAD